MEEFEEKSSLLEKIIKPAFTSDARSALSMAVAPKCMFDCL